MQNRKARREFLRFLAASPLSLLCAQERIKGPSEILSVFDFEPIAEKNLPAAHFGYLATGVDDDRTLRENHDAFSRLYLRPRRLVNVSHVDTSVELWGTKWPFPIFLCPCGSQKAFHPDGELATAHAAKARRVLQLLSTLSTVGVEEVSQAAGYPVWQQLYPTSEWTITEKIIRRADAAGCPALVITVDVPAGRNTETELRMRAKDTRPCSSCHVRPFFSGRKPMFDGLDTSHVRLVSPAFTWDSVRRVRQLTHMKIVLKGIQTAEDARMAVDHGVDAVIVSNHGGRAEESGRATIDCLPEIVKTVGSAIPVLLDGGIRRGTDVFKAIALGARAVGIGRPYLWGLAAWGQAGVERVLDLLAVEFGTTMAQCGTRSLAEITPTYVGHA